MRLLTAGLEVQVLLAELRKENSQAQRLRIFFCIASALFMSSIPSSIETTRRVSIWRSLIILLFARTILDTGFRAAYAFLPFIAANLGVPVTSAAQIIQVRNLTGFLSPVFGPLADRYGRRVMMLLGLTIAAVMGLVVYFVASLWMAIVVLTLMGLSTTLFVPAQQAFLGDNVPYAQRGRVMALAELAWSLAAIVCLPLVGYLVQTQGWRIGYVAIGIFGALACALIFFALPREKRNVLHATRAIGGSYLEALRAPMAFAVIATITLLAATNELININFAAWMNTRFGLDALAMGGVGAAIGGAEFAAQLSVAAIVDRIGKWRMVAGGLVFGGIAYLALPFMNANALWGTSGLVLVFFMFELAIVAALPLITQIAPNARATLLSLGVAGFSLGRAMGSFIGPAVYENFGFGAVSLVAAGVILVASIIWFLFVREHPPE